MDFSVGFQLRLLVLFYTDKDFYITFKDLVKAEFFNSIFCQWLFNYIEIYVEKYQGTPTYIVVDQELKTDKTFIELPEEKGLIEEFLGLLRKPDKAELQYVKDKFLAFTKSKAIKIVLNEQNEAVDSGNFEDLFASLKTESRKFELPNSERDKELFSLRNLKEIYDNKGGIATGIGLIDNTVGGLMPKELSVILADTNVGKSLSLVHIGGSAVKQFRYVTHVTLEMSFARTLARYLANLGDDEDGVTYQQILDLTFPDKLIDYVHDKLHERYEGKLQIEEFPTGKCSIQNLYNLLDKFPQTELLIVDYLQLLKPVVRRKELRFELTETAIALRGIASENKIHVATAAQASKVAHNKRIVSKELTAEDYGIMRVADIGIGMGQNKDDSLKQEVVFYLTRSRNSVKDVAERYLLDFKRMRLCLMRQEFMGDNI